MRHYISTIQLGIASFYPTSGSGQSDTQKDGLSWTFWITFGFLSDPFFLEDTNNWEREFLQKLPGKWMVLGNPSEVPRTAISSNLQFVSKKALILLAAIHCKQPPEK